MKQILISFLIIFFQSETPDVSKLYIAQDIDGIFDILKFFPDDSLLVIKAQKYPNLDYDFFGEKNISSYKKNLNDRKGYFKKDKKIFYRLKGDSIFMSSSDEILVTRSEGVFRNNIFTLKTTMSLINQSTMKLEVVKTKTNQIFRPY